MKKINIAIVDDHSLFLEGLSSILKDVDNFKILITASSAKELLNQPNLATIDVLISDISMPEMDGIALSQIIKKQFPTIKILIVSMHEETQIIKALIKMKIDGYLFKNADKELLVSAITSVAQGNLFFSEAIKNKLIFTNEEEDESSTKSILPKLSSREKEILELIAKGLTINQIADTLFISHHTVVSHKQKLFYKFNVDKITSLVKKALDLEIIN
ncbi:response regulator transcription factor [Flavobacterium sp. j3]|jgi:DNA-binding NarL/FixJ family response regulator|uniref:Response regulator transcription factor n=1 Tax=Flavobacterium aureirubrum TaxID=3133147 RepID=A0ABU9N361_9FLAO|nr:response regulator transcription factor [Flavobacterium sp.]MCZ8296582.1 response regulator transcription factor [Flavobacterium sp.]